MKSKVISISMKDRGAILPGGKTGTAYFFDRAVGQFITSSYYQSDYPAWWQKHYQSRPQDKWFHAKWTPVAETEVYRKSAPTGRATNIDYRGLGKSFPHTLGVGMDGPGPAYYSALTRTPFGDDYTLDFVKSAVEGEALGRNPEGVPDLLAISFSCHDYVNHHFGPESQESLDDLLRLNQTLDELFSFLNEWVGMDSVLFALSSDHGFCETPEYLAAQGISAGRVDPRAMVKALNDSLSKEFGSGEFVAGWYPPTLYLDYAVAGRLGVSAEAVENRARDFLVKYPGLRWVFTRSELQSRSFQPSPLAILVNNAWDPVLSGDLFLIQESGWFLLGNPSSLAATHGSAYFYDRNVPLMFLGPWFKQGRFGQAEVVDLASTLAHVLGIRAPSGSEGRVLHEILAVSSR
jgi:hypothetical protein